MKKRYSVTLDPRQVNIVDGKLSTVLNDLLTEHNVTVSEDTDEVLIRKRRIGKFNKEIQKIKDKYNELPILEKLVKDLIKEVSLLNNKKQSPQDL